MKKLALCVVHSAFSRRVSLGTRKKSDGLLIQREKRGTTARTKMTNGLVVLLARRTLPAHRAKLLFSSYYSFRSFSSVLAISEQPPFRCMIAPWMIVLWASCFRNSAQPLLMNLLEVLM